MKLEDLKKELLPYHISMFERCDEWWLASNNPGAALMIVKVSASRTPQIIHHPEEVLAPEALAARSKRQSQIEAAYLCHCRKKFEGLVDMLQNMCFQFEHNGDESDSDKAVLDAAEKALRSAEEVEGC